MFIEWFDFLRNERTQKGPVKVDLLMCVAKLQALNNSLNGGRSVSPAASDMANVLAPQDYGPGRYASNSKDPEQLRTNFWLVHLHQRKDGNAWHRSGVCLQS
jgi:hypothetical protein